MPFARTAPSPEDVRAMTNPLLLVIEHDLRSQATLLAGLRRRFGDDFTVRGSGSADDALAALRAARYAAEPVALLLVDAASSDVLAAAHHLHPRAKRVLLVDRDYSSTSPAVQAMALGLADYHIVRPWSDDEAMF